MKKYIGYIIITALLTAVSIYFFSNRKQGTLGVNTNYFAVQDTSQITGIQISTITDTLLLEEIGEKWMVNHTFNARTKMIKVLMGLFSTIEIKAPVSKSIKQQVLHQFQKNALHVQFEINNRVYKEFEICEIDSLSIGSFIRKPGSDDVYIAGISGHEGKLSLLFPIKPGIWRDNTIFCYKPWQILTIRVEYPDKPDQSFILELADPEKIKITGFLSKNPILLQKENIVRYLLNFNAVNYEPIPGYKRRLTDSLLRSKPGCKITIKSIENQYNEIKLYAIPIPNKTEKIDLFKMYAVIQNDSFPVYVKYADFDLIMKSYKEFIAREKKRNDHWAHQ